MLTKLTSRDAAKYYGCGYDYFMKLYREGKFTGCFYKVGRKPIFIKEKLDSLVEQLLKDVV